MTWFTHFPRAGDSSTTLQLPVTAVGMAPDIDAPPPSPEILARLAQRPGYTSEQVDASNRGEESWAPRGAARRHAPRVPRSKTPPQPARPVTPPPMHPMPATPTVRVQPANTVVVSRKPLPDATSRKPLPDGALLHVQRAQRAYRAHCTAEACKVSKEEQPAFEQELVEFFEQAASIDHVSLVVRLVFCDFHAPNEDSDECKAIPEALLSTVKYMTPLYARLPDTSSVERLRLFRALTGMSALQRARIYSLVSRSTPMPFASVMEDVRDVQDLTSEQAGYLVQQRSRMTPADIRILNGLVAEARHDFLAHGVNAAPRLRRVSRKSVLRCTEPPTVVRNETDGVCARPDLQTPFV